MKITKYPQSCLKLESHNRLFLIDPGTLATAAYRLSDFGEIDALLFTHSHPDHFDVHALPELLERGVGGIVRWSRPHQACPTWAI